MSFKVVKIIRQNTAGVRRQVVAAISGDVYATNGSVNTVSKITGGRIREADFLHLPALSNSGTYYAYVVHNSDDAISDFKIRIFVVATGAEVANATDLSAEKWRVVIQGA